MSGFVICTKESKKFQAQKASSSRESKHTPVSSKAAQKSRGYTLLSPNFFLFFFPVETVYIFSVLVIVIVLLLPGFGMIHVIRDDILYSF